MKSSYKQINLSSSIWKVPGKYTNLNYLGSGAFGQVCSARDENLRTTVAIKKIKDPFASVDHAKRVYREIKLLKHMHHDNIIKLIDVFTPDEDSHTFKEIYMVSILMDQDLRKLLDQFKLTDNQVKLVLYQILRALKYLHSGGIMHRVPWLKYLSVFQLSIGECHIKDLKPSNIAINDNFEIKILDFGLSRQINRKENMDLTPYIVARSYRAPEILFNWMHYKQNVDIWSTGCIFAELLTNKVLFKCDDSIQLINCIFDLLGTPSDDLLRKMTSEDACNYIRDLSYKQRKSLHLLFPEASPIGLDLLEKMFDLDPDTRISAVGSLAHPFLSALADPLDEPELQPFDSSFEDDQKKLECWREMIYQEF